MGWIGGSKYCTACPQEIVPRGGHPLGLMEYIIERVYQVFLSIELHKFGIFWNLHQPKGVPTPHFSSTYRFLGGAHPSLFINLKVFRVPTPYFSSTYRILGGCPPLTFHQSRSPSSLPWYFPTIQTVGLPAVKHCSHNASWDGLSFSQSTAKRWWTLHRQRRQQQCQQC